MCYILWEEAKWKQCNLGDQYRAESGEPAGRSENTKHQMSPLLRPLLHTKILIPAYFFEACRLVLKKKRKYRSGIIGSGLHALPFLTSHTKAAGGSSKFLGQADNVEMLTTANLNRVSDLRTTAGDGEYGSNGFQLCLSRQWQETWARLPERSCQSLRAAWIFLSLVECKRHRLHDSYLGFNWLAARSCF